MKYPIPTAFVLASAMLQLEQLYWYYKHIYF